MNIFFKLSIFSLMIFATTFISGNVLAQTETTPSLVPTNAVLVANINIYNTAIVRQEGNTVVIGFDVKNEGATIHGDVVEPGLTYGLKVIDGKTTNENGMTLYGKVMDEQVSDDVFSLNTGEKVHKEIEYTAPPSFDGEYYIQVYGIKENGLPYALAYVEEPVVFQGSQDVFSVAVSDCSMTVGSEPQEYNTEFGVDVDSSETLYLKCNLVAGGVLGSYTPEITIYKRSISGDVIHAVQLEKKELVNKTENDVLFTIPVPAEPQAYDAQLTLLGEGGTAISNSVVGHFVVRGDSATIHDVQLDKDYYRAGEQAEVVLNISGEAGAFPGSRAQQSNLPTTTGDGGYWYKVSIVSGDTTCGDSGDAKQFVFNEYGIQVIPIAITADCLNPSTNVVLTNKDGAVYDEKEFAVMSKTDIPQEVNPAPVPLEDDMTTSIHALLLILSLVVLIIIVVIGYFMYERFKKTPEDTETSNTSSVVGLLILVAVSSLFFGSSSVHAATYSIPTANSEVGGVPTPQFTILILNNTKEFYLPTEDKITVNYSGTLKSCGNVPFGFALFGGHVAYTPDFGTPIFKTGDILGAITTTKTIENTTIDFSGVSFDRPMTTKNPGTGNVVPLTAMNYVTHRGDGTGVCDMSLECTNVCNNYCDTNLSWVAQSTGYNEHTCECYIVHYDAAQPMDFDHPYGIETIVTEPLTVIVTPDNAVKQMGENVTWHAEAYGGTPPYSYQWSGEIVNSWSATNSFIEQYMDLGEKTVLVEVRDSSEPVKNNSDSGNVIIKDNRIPQ
jgi:hypothetical protein